MDKLKTALPSGTQMYVTNDTSKYTRTALDAVQFDLGLAVLLVGNNLASAIYVSNKVRACQEIGIRSLRFDLPATIDTDTLVGKIEELNVDQTGVRSSISC